jgi:hypothetical protein
MCRWGEGMHQLQPCCPHTAPTYEADFLPSCCLPLQIMRVPWFRTEIEEWLVKHGRTPPQLPHSIPALSGGCAAAPAVQDARSATSAAWSDLVSPAA